MIAYTALSKLMIIMRIKTWVNDTVREFASKTWPQKTVRCNYNVNSSRMRDENRWIKISSPIDDDYIHYEITHEHIELHFEYSNSKDKGITANAELVDYLEKQTETSNQYVWTDFLGGDSVRCVYIEKIHEWDMLDKLYDVVTYFDKLISDYLTNNQMAISTSKIIVDNSIKAPNYSVELTTYPLEEVFKRLSNITPLHIISLCKKYSQFGLYLDIGQLRVDSNFQFQKEYYD